ncbi:MAG: DUF3847 domain-containing protein [Lachnospiraceae bacterium]|nr:DUF3847 domain-containing protein [Lachnospiraceae bacterium]
MEKKQSIINELKTTGEILRMREEEKKAEKEVAYAKHSLNKVKNLIQTEKEKERKNRNHRLISRGAQIEYVFPESRELTQDQFIELCNILLDSNEVKERVRRLISEIKGGK